MKPIPRKAQTASAGSRERGRILIISDETELTWCSDLEATGHEIVDVAIGAAALVSLRRSRPHLVVASSNAKGLSNSELVRMLNQIDDGVPLVMFGREELTIERREAVLASGAFDYFQIPGELESFTLRVNQIVKLRQTM